MSCDGAADAREESSPLLWSLFTEAAMTIHGEVDIFTCDLFAAMLEEAVGRADSAVNQAEVHVDLSGVDFIDTRGAQALVAASAGRRPESQLVIHHAPSLLALILDVGWGVVPGLKLEASRAAAIPVVPRPSALTRDREYLGRSSDGEESVAPIADERLGLPCQTDGDSGLSSDFVA
jgi:anti-anti-sigma regulatory factor